MLPNRKSDDKGTAVNGGELGYFGRGQMVGPFERLAFKLKPDSISEIIETQFGYHIIQVIDRKGEKVNARHILIKPLIVSSDYVGILNEMKELITKIQSDEISLCKAAKTISIDELTKENCGYFTDPGTGAQLVQVTSLDPAVASKVGEMKPGDYSEPEQFMNYDQTLSYRFLYLKSYKDRHKANLSDDYQKIQQMALDKKKKEEIKTWVEGYKGGVYIWIDNKYVNCDELSGWKGLNN